VTIDKQRLLQPERWKTIMEKLKMEWTYDSNAIEGSTLTLGETIFFLREDAFAAEAAHIVQFIR
jgi:hypothetical protein